MYVQDLLNGLTSAGIYILIALGLTLILGIVGSLIEVIRTLLKDTQEP